MKARIFIYIIFGCLSALGIGIYFINPNNPVLQVTMSFGASLIGAVFVAIITEAISNGKQKRSVKAIQTHLMASLRQSFKGFYLWLGNYLVRKFDVVNFDYSKIETSPELYAKLFDECNNKIGKLSGEEVENLLDFIILKTNPLVENLEKLNQIINEEIATLFTNEVLDEDDVEYLNRLKQQLTNVQSSESFAEITNYLQVLISELNSKQVLRLELNEMLTDRLIRKFSMPEEK